MPTHATFQFCAEVHQALRTMPAVMAIHIPLRRPEAQQHQACWRQRLSLVLQADWNHHHQPRGDLRRDLIAEGRRHLIEKGQRHLIEREWRNLIGRERWHLIEGGRQHPSTTWDKTVTDEIILKRAGAEIGHRNAGYENEILYVPKHLFISVLFRGIIMHVNCINHVYN